MIQNRAKFFCLCLRWSWCFLVWQNFLFSHQINECFFAKQDMLWQLHIVGQGRNLTRHVVVTGVYSKKWIHSANTRSDGVKCFLRPPLFQTWFSFKTFPPLFWKKSTWLAHTLLVRVIKPFIMKVATKRKSSHKSSESEMIIPNDDYENTEWEKFD